MPTIIALIRKIIGKANQRNHLKPARLRTYRSSTRPGGQLQSFFIAVVIPIEEAAELIVIWKNSKIAIMETVQSSYPIVSFVIPILFFIVIAAAALLDVMRKYTGETMPSILPETEVDSSAIYPLLLSCRGGKRIRREDDFFSTILDEMRDAPEGEQIYCVEAPLYNGILIAPSEAFLAEAKKITTAKRLEINYVVVLPEDLQNIKSRELEAFLALWPFAQLHIAHLTEYVTSRYLLQSPSGTLWVFAQRAVLSYRRNIKTAHFTSGTRSQTHDAYVRAHRLHSRYSIIAIEPAEFLDQMRRPPVCGRLLA